jgi:NAD(P)-dependent dehydrogenase (short-subunit alcohol dehydrogenase family)
MTQSIANKIAIVTGGSRGIGRAICHGLAAQGCNVIVSSRTEENFRDIPDYQQYAGGTIHDTVKTIVDNGGNAFAHRCDVSKAGDIESLCSFAYQKFGRIDILVSNAGIDCESPVVDLPVSLIDDCLAVNIRSHILLCKYALPHIIDHGEGGSIFAVSSGASRGYREGRVGYSMSKAAVDRMFLSLAEEVKPHDIAVNVLSPGRVDTWMNRRGDWPGTAHIPMVAPDEITPSAIWLAQQTAGTFTGNLVERSEFGITWGDT